MATVSIVHPTSAESGPYQPPTISERPESHTRHTALLRIVRQLTDVADPDSLMRCLVDEAIALLRGQVGSVACWSEEEGVLKRAWRRSRWWTVSRTTSTRAKGSAARSSCCGAR